ncbi:porin [Salipiger sp. IMCC34102]|uniref:porin n=1 Tax=Salipiger sp. IMCC34102 TaxID=2510647 RepID=UPI0013EB2321|nr:porin [Salipiger sp. IMCC34102]
MKRILLTSTALVAFAGAAMAQDMLPAPMADGTPNASAAGTDPMPASTGVQIGADGSFGYNEEVEGGFYFEGGLMVTTSAGMNMGLNAGIELDIDISFGDAERSQFSSPGGSGAFDDIVIDGSDFVIFVEGQGAGLYVGDTETGAETRWAGTTNMETDGFLEVGDVDDGQENGDFIDGVIRGDLEYANFAASLSFLLVDGENDLIDTGTELDGLDGLSLGVEGTFGNFVVGMAYQEGIDEGLVDFNPGSDENDDGIIEAGEGDQNDGTVDELVGLYAGTTFSGADVKIAYSRNLDTDEDSTGLQVGYPFGPVTATAFYSFESEGDDNYGVGVAYEANGIAVAAYYHDGQDEELGIEGSYDLMNGLQFFAGYVEGNDDLDDYEAYVAAAYDLGGGAALVASYGDVGDDYSDDLDEVGNAYEVNDGVTVGVSFEF